MRYTPILTGLISLALSINAQADWVRTDRQLTTQPIDLLRLTTDTLVTLDPDTADTNTIATTDTIRLTRQFPETSTAQPSAPTITLDDGQHLTAPWRPDAEGQTFSIDHPQLGRLTIPLDRIATITWPPNTLQATPPQTNDARSDRIQLTNGDQLQATLLALFDQSARLLLPGNPQPIDLPLSSIHAIQRAHEPATTTRADRLTLATGEVIDAARVSFQQNTWTLSPTLALSPVQLPAAAINQLELRRNGLRLTPLLQQPLQINQPTVVFGVPMPPRQTSDTLAIHAPADIAFDLPPTAAAISLELQLDPSIPAHDRHWPSMIATVSTQASTATQITLDDANPKTVITLPVSIPNAQLRLTLDPHTRGPVLDRLQIRNAVILLAEPPPLDTPTTRATLNR
ncbi:hypothetical protein [Mucisphaera sp.]|uniref:hypothetical protein n=1 Tax=Mucisphaera sp. TaxID=2913024 RepID=UPI003D0B6FF0